MIRNHYIKAIERQLKIHTLCGILGPRPVGKTTLARAYIQQEGIEAVFFDLENPLDLARLENPMLALENITNKLIVIDEIQRRPDLFPVLRVLADQKEKNRKFLILESASRDLIRQSSETLAGRIGYLELPPFTLNEVDNSSQLWLRGGFPGSYLADSNADSYQWRRDYITTFLERDIPNLGFSIPPNQLRRFWLMLAHYHGQIFNASELGASLGVSHHTVQRYLDILAGTFMVRILVPWFENLKKRQVKSPKIYFRDSGILHALVGIESKEQLESTPKLGSYWEGFALEQIIIASNANSEECFFWATQSQAELDLLIMKNSKRIGFEFKYTDSPQSTKAMHTAIEDLHLDHLVLVYPGSIQFPLDKKITAFGLNDLTKKESVNSLFLGE